MAVFVDNKGMRIKVNCKTLHKICRLCASDVGPMKEIFQRNSRKTSDVGAKIYNCTSIEVSKSERLSSQICETCDKLVETFHTFKMRCIEVNVELLKLLEKDQTIMQESEIATAEHFDPNLQLGQPDASSVCNDPTSGKQVDVPVTIQKNKITRRSSRLKRNSMNISVPGQPDDSLKDPSARNTGGTTVSMTGLVGGQHASSPVPPKQQSRNLDAVQQTNLPPLNVERNELKTVQADPLALVLCSYANDSNENKPEILNVLGGESLINNKIHNYNGKYIHSFETFIKSKEVFPVESLSTSREFTGRNIKQNCKNCGKTITSINQTNRDVCTACRKQNNKRNAIESFECDICPKVFKSELVLSKHNMKCHAARLNKFRCSVCGVRCTSGEALLTHLKKKHGGCTNVTCCLCNKSTARHKSLAALLVHMDRRHDMGASVASSTDEDEEEARHSLDDPNSCDGEEDADARPTLDDPKSCDGEGDADARPTLDDPKSCEEEGARAPPKRRGRPPKNSSATAVGVAPRRGRGRPPKNSSATAAGVASRKGRGRPPKKTARPEKTAEPSLCSYCGKTFNNATGMIAHVRFSHLGVKRYECDACGRRFVARSNLLSHIQATHGDGTRFQCPLCDVTLCSSLGLRSHLHKHARRQAPPAHKCPVCPRMFRKKEYVERHVRSHTGETPFKCAYCPREFTVDWNRTQHERLHTGEKRYACDVCGKAFTHNVSRKNHMKYHADDEMGEAEVEEMGLSHFLAG